MSTILKALRRLEEDSSPDGSASIPPASSPGSLPATDAHATDELRSRILAEEAAAEVGGTDVVGSSTSRNRARIIMAIAGASILAALAVGLVFGFASTTPDEASESATVASPSPSPPAQRRPSVSPPPPSPGSPTFLAHEIEQPPPTPDRGRSGDFAAGDPNPKVVALPLVQSGTSHSNGTRSTDLPRPASADAASALSASKTVPRLTREPAPRRIPPEDRAVAAGVPTPPARKSEIANPMVASAAESVTRPIVKAPSKSQPTTKPTTKPTLKPKPPTRSQAKASSEPTAQPAATTVEEHRGRSIPDLTVLRTAWHPNRARRSAKIRLLDTKETLNLKEGDAVGGLVIQEISPSAVIFRSGDIELRLRVGRPGSGG